MPDVHLRQRRSWVIAGIAGVLTVAVVVLAVAIVHFSLVTTPSGVTIQAGPTPTYGPTPTLAPTQQLAWKQLAVPARFNQPGSAVSPVLAPSDAYTAYACFWSILDQSAAPEVWVTHNGGDSWRMVGHLPANPAGPCSLTVDATQSNALVATTSKYFSGHTPPLPPDGQNFASIDGGHTWTRIGL